MCLERGVGNRVAPPEGHFGRKSSFDFRRIRIWVFEAALAAEGFPGRNIIFLIVKINKWDIGLHKIPIGDVFFGGFQKWLGEVFFVSKGVDGGRVFHFGHRFLREARD